MKVCNVCKETKEYSEFYADKTCKDNLRYKCKTCDKKYSRKWHKENLERSRKNTREYYFKNKEKVISKNRERYRKNPCSNLNHCTSIALRRAIRNIKYNSSYFDKLGYTKYDFIKHIKRKFKKGMTLNNHGEIWEIDHIVPVCKFDCRKKDQYKKCWSLKNLQPLYVQENRSKGNKYSGSPDNIIEVYHEI